MKILVLDNYDSFTYNLVHYLAAITGEEIEVYRNDAIGIDEVERFDKVVLSPGPGLPNEAGIQEALIEKYAGRIPILGVCLGHQAIVEVFGGKLQNLDQVYHGMASTLHVIDPEDRLFKGLPAGFQVGRYHSWVADREELPDGLELTAVEENGHVMAMRHKEYDLYGVQFHPESVLTEHGMEIMGRWVTDKSSF